MSREHTRLYSFILLLGSTFQGFNLSFTILEGSFFEDLITLRTKTSFTYSFFPYFANDAIYHIFFVYHPQRGQ